MAKSPKPKSAVAKVQPKKPAAGPHAEGERLVHPLEPVVANGRGMHVMGFVPLGGLRTTPLAPAKPPAPAASVGAKKRAGEAADGAADGAAEESRAAGRGRGRGEGGGGRGRGGRGGGGGRGDRGEVTGPGHYRGQRPVFEHGNYHRYYGYRGEDRRLAAVADKLGSDVFAGREVLDIGCNSGAVALAVRRAFGARRVVGVDIDADLIKAADASLESHEAVSEDGGGVEFRAEDFLSSPLKRNGSETPERFDAILLLSVTKWVHFAAGDSGMRKLFRRCEKRLRPGGLLVLEPQNWDTYKKKRHLTPEIRETVAGIEMRPEAFGEYLEGLGFENVGTIEPPSDKPKGFQRFIRLFRKPAEEAAEEEAEGGTAGATGTKPKRKRAAAEPAPDPNPSAGGEGRQKRKRPRPEPE